MNSRVFVISTSVSLPGMPRQSFHFNKSKNIGIMTYKMKKLICAILYIMLASPFCFCLSDFHFSFAPVFSLTYGELTEQLYDSEGELVSQLDWEQKPLFDIGIKSKIIFKNVSLSGLFNFSVPIGTSYMYDSDWENGRRYSYTIHPITNSKNINSEASLAYTINTPSIITVIPELQFDYLYSSLEGGIGEGIRYGKNKRYYGVDYSRHSFFIFTGLSVEADLTQNIFLKTAFYTAVWNYQDSFDYHHGVKHPFSSRELQEGWFTKYKANISTEFKIDRIISLELFTNLLFGFPDKGIFYSDYFNSDKLELIKSQQSGANIHSLKIGTALNFSF